MSEMSLSRTAIFSANGRQCRWPVLKAWPNRVDVRLGEGCRKTLAGRLDLAFYDRGEQSVKKNFPRPIHA